MDCHWSITTASGYEIQLKFENLNFFGISNNDTDCSSFAEIRDGGGPFSEIIDKLCRNAEEKTYRTSGRAAFLRVVGDGIYLKISVTIKKC